METPFSTPPVPSGAPYSFNLTPLTGIGTCPCRDAKVAFASLHGQVPIPVNGVKLKEYGAPDGTGGGKGCFHLATRGGARVPAPADGCGVYAAPFRSYGQLD